MLLLEATLHDKLVVAVNGPAGAQLGEQEREQVLGLPVQHLGNLSKIGERRFLSSHPHNLKIGFGN